MNWIDDLVLDNLSCIIERMKRTVEKRRRQEQEEKKREEVDREWKGQEECYAK